MNPTQNRPRKGAPSRAIRTWRESFNGHVHSAPDSNLPTVNLPANPDRNPLSLAKVRHLPSAQELCVDAFCGCQASDGQIATNPRNYSSTVYNISQDRVSHDAFALIEHIL
jgi:hypothetical protein